MKLGKGQGIGRKSRHPPGTKTISVKNQVAVFHPQSRPAPGHVTGTKVVVLPVNMKGPGILHLQHKVRGAGIPALLKNRPHIQITVSIHNEQGL